MTSGNDPSGSGSLHAFVDESKRKGFSLVRCDVLADDVNRVRADLRALLRGGQRRIHFYKESDAVRKALLAVARAAGVAMTVYSSGGHESQARAACIRALARDIAQESRVSNLVIESDQTHVSRDREQLHVWLASESRAISWCHLPAFAEPCLWLPDAVGWCMDHPEAKWRRAIGDLTVRRVTC